MNILILQNPSNGMQNNYMNLADISVSTAYRLASDLELYINTNVNIDDIKNDIRTRIRRRNVYGEGLIQVFQPSGRG